MAKPTDSTTTTDFEIANKNTILQRESSSTNLVDNDGSTLASAQPAFIDECEPALKWKKPSESMFYVQKFIRKGISPRHILNALYPMHSVPTDIPDVWIVQLLRELCEQTTRTKLPEWNSFNDAVELFRQSKKILVITGAGVSVSCGIPDFRSENGIYARLHKDCPELPNPHAMFDIDFFRSNPAPFYNFAREIFPGQYCPSISHMFIKFLEEDGKLLRNYTQNIDTLERVAGIANLVECHGSFARSTCLNCKHEIDSELIRKKVLAQCIVHCSKCKIGVMKPNIVFFGEDLGDAFHTQMGDDHDKLDLLVVIGSSMQVRPVSLIPYNIRPDVPQILINREPLPKYQADIKLLGNCDLIISLLALSLGGAICVKMLKELESRIQQQIILSSDIISQVKQLTPDQKFYTKRIDVCEFKQIIGTTTTISEKTTQNTDEEPELKRPKLNGVDEEDEPNNIWEGNYVLVESRLPMQNSYVLVPPNLNVFVGAKLFYDKDQDTFVHRTGIKQRYMDDDDEHDASDGCSQSDDDFSISDSNSSDCSIKDRSLPPELEGDIQIKIEENAPRRGQSCPPKLMCKNNMETQENK